jgi:hypothetical protein
MRQQIVRLLALGFVIVGLISPNAPSWVGAVYASEGISSSQCFAACSAENAECNDWCRGCPYYDGASYTHWSSGLTVNCAGGIEQCMNDCHHGCLICYVNC